MPVQVEASRESTKSSANFDVTPQLHAEHCDDLSPVAPASEKGCCEVRVGAGRRAPVELLFDGSEHVVHDCFGRQPTRQLGAERGRSGG